VTFPFSVVVTIAVVMFAGGVEPACVEELVSSTGVGESSTQASAEATPVTSAVEVVALMVTTVMTPEVPVVTSAMIELLTGLAPVVLGELSAPSSASTGTVHAIVETGPGSALAEPTLTMDIMEELALQMIQQFFTTMKSCIELVLFGPSSFELTRTLLENQIENICQIEGSEQAKAH